MFVSKNTHKEYIMDITSLTNHKLPKLSSYYNVKLMLLIHKYFGYWPSLNGNQRLYAIYTFFSFTLTIGWIVLSEMIYMVIHISDFKKLTSISILLMTNVIHVFKVQNLISKRKQIRHLLEDINAGQFSNETDKYERIITYFSWSGLFHYALNVLFGIGAITGWSIISLFSIKNDKTERKLPNYGWFPYDPLISPAFELTSVYEILVLYVCAFHNLAVDHLIVGFMSVVCCQFVILNCKLQSIGDDILNAESRKNDLSDLLKNNKNDDLIYERLIKCVENHIAIIQFARNVENIFNFIIFLQFLESCLVICVTAYQLSQESNKGASVFWGNFSYLICLVYQLFIYCWYGNSILLLIIIMFWYQERIQLLLKFTNEDVFTQKDKKLKLIIARYTLNGLFDYVARQCIVILGLICWNFLLIRNVISGHVRNLSTDGWYPYNVTKSPAFEITFVHQILFGTIALFYNVALDTLITGLIAAACCKLELLKCSIIDIGRTIETECLTFGAKLKTQVKRKDNFYEQLKECVDYNNKIFNFAKEIESIFGIVIFLQFLVNCLTICLSIFTIVQLMNRSLDQYVGMFLYMASMVYEIFVYCWHGNELRLQSESVIQAAFSGNWWKSSERYKRALRLIMVRAGKPLYITTGNLLTLSLSTFMGILKASYSFFTVLQSTTTKKN